MHAGKVLAYHSYAEELCARKDGNDRSQKRKTRDAAFKEISADDIHKNSDAKQCTAKPNQTGKLQRRCAEAGHHVKCVANQLRESVIRRARMSRTKNDRYCSEARCSPCQQHVDRNKRCLMACECLAQLCAKNAERADVFGKIPSNSGA